MINILIQLKDQQILSYRFSAFWLRSKCSICSYQLNIWYEDHVSSSILNLFLQGDGMSGACSGSIKSWPSIAVPLGLAHFPTKKKCDRSFCFPKSFIGEHLDYVSFLFGKHWVCACFWPLTASITLEVKNNLAHVTTQRILNKLKSTFQWNAQRCVLPVSFPVDLLL